MIVKMKLTPGLPKDHVKARLIYHNRSADVHRRALAFYLENIDSRRLYLDLGASSTAQFAKNELDMNEITARALVKTERDLKELRKISKADFTRSTEFRRHVHMTVVVDDEEIRIDIDSITDDFKRTKKFFYHILDLVEPRKED